MLTMESVKTGPFASSPIKDLPPFSLGRTVAIRNPEGSERLPILGWVRMLDR